MRAMLAAAAAILALSGAAFAQAAAQTPPTPEQTASLGWMAGHRIHVGPDGRQVHEAFLGPVNGVVTGTALAGVGTDRAYTEYHRIGPNASGVYGLSVASTRSGMVWNFVPLKSIEPGRITFQSEDGSLTVAYYKEGDGGVGSRVDRKADGQTRTMEWHFKLTPQSAK